MFAMKRYIIATAVCGATAVLPACPQVGAHPPPMETRSGQVYIPAWSAAYRFLEEEYPRYNHKVQSHEERMKCLEAALKASYCLLCDPYASSVFNWPMEPFLLLVAQAVAESGGNPQALSSDRRDLGWAQINVTMLHTLGVTDPFDVEQSAMGQAMHLRNLLRTFTQQRGEGEQNMDIIEKAVAAYNAGSRAVLAGRIPSTTRTYVERVSRHYDRLRQYALQDMISPAAALSGGAMLPQ